MSWSNCQDRGERHRYGDDTVTCVACGAQRVGYRAQNGQEQRRAAMRRAFNAPRSYHVESLGEGDWIAS